MKRIAAFTAWCAGLVAIHGVLLGLIALLPQVWLPEWLQVALLVAFAVPALLLAYPLQPMLWKWRLMEAPGWFAWPKPMGFLATYAVWIIVLLLLTTVFRMCARWAQSPQR